MNKASALTVSPAYRIMSISVLITVTAVFTLLIRVRVPKVPTRGYINLSDVAIYFTAFTFGSTALIAGGLGTAIGRLVGWICTMSSDISSNS